MIGPGAVMWGVESEWGHNAIWSASTTVDLPYDIQYDIRQSRIICIRLPFEQSGT